MNTSLLTRFAPTPSGFLHLGNVFNCLLIYLISESNHCKRFLRIDDIDQERFRREYLDNIFETIEWLGITFDIGPSTAEEFLRNFSQAKNLDFYRVQLAKLGDLYACQCSRSKLSLNKSSIYPGTCRVLKLNNEDNNLRVGISSDIEIELENLTRNVKNEIGDFIIWRKNDFPAYHLVSLVDDVHHGVNLIVRGEDLYDSTFTQIYLAKSMGELKYLQVNYYHHPLLKINNQKLSKSVMRGGSSVINQMSKELVFCEFLNWLGIKTKHQNITLSNLVEITKDEISNLMLHQARIMPSINF